MITINEAAEMVHGKDWPMPPINTVHCTECQIGFDIPGGVKPGEKFSYETKECPNCAELIEVTVQARGKIPF